MLFRTKILLVFCWLFVVPFEGSASSPDGANVKGEFVNASLLNALFEKLYILETQHKGKVNIVHIGDSHIQADLFTNVIRQRLQAQFGNGGYGFTFPYKLAKTNGSSYVQYTSDIDWNSRRNIYPVTDVSIGLSGIGLYTNKENFHINIQVSPLYVFNKVKILYPTQYPLFNIEAEDGMVVTPSLKEVEQVVSKEEGAPIKHKIEAGETLYRIAGIYKVSIDELKRINNLQSNTIQKGAELIISDHAKTEVRQVVMDTVKQTNITKTQDRFDVQIKPYYSVYTLPNLVDDISIYPNKKHREYSLSGIVLENGKPGVIYHNIGVNGTKVSDYNKYPLFFEQLPVLNPDLVIISLGTNEAFGKWSSTYYMSQMQIFIDKIRAKNPKAIILLMSSPPSLFNRKLPNTFVEDYSKALKLQKNCVVWDLFSKVGGLDAPNRSAFSPMMAKDKVHYTKEGYEMQGELFSIDFLSAYDNYVKNK